MSGALRPPHVKRVKVFDPAVKYLAGKCGPEVMIQFFYRSDLVKEARGMYI
jgi:hypothetical protein